MTDFIELFLTCEDQAKADKIAKSLLDQHLIACAKFEPVRSKFWWKDELEAGDEIKLGMLSLAANFDRIETEVAKLHSYETFVLQAIPILKINKAAAAWLNENSQI